jgi:hypothetical protein
MKSATTKTLNGPGGIRILLDASEIFPDDPGQGTPALVQLFGATGTYWCVSAEGELLEGGTTRRLTPEQCRWLNDQEDVVTDFLRANGG